MTASRSPRPTCVFSIEIPASRPIRAAPATICPGRQDRDARRPHRRVHAEAAVRPVPRHLRGRLDADDPEAHLRRHRLQDQSRPTTRRSAPAPSCSRSGRRARSSSWSRTRTTTIKGKPYLDEIYWQVIPDAAARVGGVRDRQGRRAARRLGRELRRAAAGQAARTPASPARAGSSSRRIAWLWLNNRQGPLANKQFRQAVMYAIDRDFAKDVIWNGLGKVATGPIRPRPSSTTPTTCRSIAYDPAKAKALLKEAGYKGEKIRLLPLPYGETWQRWAEAVKQNLPGRRHQHRDRSRPTLPAGTRRSATGTTTSPSPTSTSTAIPRSASAATTSPATSPRASRSTTSRAIPIPRSTSCSPTARSPTPDAKRKEIYAKAQKILVDDVPVAVAARAAIPDHHRCNVKNLDHHRRSASMTASATHGSTSNA